eukprot:361485-Chlamydomonas_euryale.AAC.6
MGGRCWAARSALTALLASQHCRQPCIAVAASAQAAAATPATARGLASTTARLQPLSGIRCVDGAAQQAMPQRQLWRACQPHLSMPGLHTLTGVAAAVGASAPALADAHDACGGAARARNVALLAASAVAGAAVLVGGGVLADSPKQVCGDPCKRPYAHTCKQQACMRVWHACVAYKHVMAPSVYPDVNLRQGGACTQHALRPWVEDMHVTVSRPQAEGHLCACMALDHARGTGLGLARRARPRPEAEISVLCPRATQPRVLT